MSRPPDAPDAPPSPREDLAARLKRQQREAEEALGPEGRIRLALTLGLRARALGKLVPR